MWLFDRLMNRKIEGKSSLDNVEPLLEKVVVSGDNVSLPDNLEVQGKNLNLNSYSGDNPSNYGLFDYHEVTLSEQLDDDGKVYESVSLSPALIKYSYTDETDSDNVVEKRILIGDIDGNANPYISVTDGNSYVNIGKSYINIGDAYSDKEIYIESNDTDRVGLHVPESRRSAIANIPNLVNSVENFGTKSADFSLDLSAKGKYTFTELTGTVSNLGDGVALTITLPSSVKCVVFKGNMASELTEDGIEGNIISATLSDGSYVDLEDGSGFVLNVLITDYVAYVRYVDNN